MAPDENSSMSSQTGDPVAVILARMEVKLDNALTEQARHSRLIDDHDRRLRDVESDMHVAKSADLSARMSRVESKVYMAAGFAAALGAGGGVGLSKLLGG